MKFEGRSVAITGGTSGIGKELVKQLVNDCDEIVVIARNQKALSELSSQFDNVSCYKCDIANDSELKLTIAKIIKAHPKLSLFINNAGIQNNPKFIDEDFDYDAIELETQINLIAPMKISALLIEHFLTSKNDTAFVNLTSGLAIFPKTSSAVYCATKAGLRNFSKSLRYQLENTSVSIFEAVVPLAETPMTEGRGINKMKASDVAADIIRGVEENKNEIYIGKSKLLPIQSRLAPKLTARKFKRG